VLPFERSYRGPPRPGPANEGFQHSSNAVTSTGMAPTGGSGQPEGGAIAGGL